MATQGNTSDWKSELLKRLRHRNKSQRYTFSGLIHAHNRLFESTTTLKTENIQLSVEAQKLREENLHLQSSGASVGGEKTQVLEQKLYKLQEELTELHRKKSENSQHIINLNASVIEKDKALLQKDIKISDCEETMVGLRSAMKHIETTVVELEATNQMLKDEHQALQLAFTALEDKYRKIQEENSELVSRWMNQKSKDADRMNAENDKFVKKRQAQLKKDLAEAASEPKTIKEPIGFLPPALFGVSFTIPTKAQYKFDAHDGEVHAIEWSPTGTVFGTGGMDRKVKLWEVINGKCEMKAMLVGSNAGIMSIDFDLQRPVVSTDGQLRHKVAESLGGETGVPRQITADNPDTGKFVIDHDLRIEGTSRQNSYYSYRLQMLNLATELMKESMDKFLAQENLWKNATLSFALTREQENLVIGASNDFASRVWSLNDHRLRHTLTGHSGKVLSAKFMGEGHRVVSGSHDRTIKAWDLISKACVKTIFAGSSCNDLVSLDDNNIISGHFDKRVRFWDVRTDSSTNEILLQGRVTSLDLTADRLTLLGCTKDNTIKIVDLRTNHVFTTLCHDNFKVAFDWTRAKFSPDGEFVCAGAQDGSVLIWNVSKGKVEQILKDHSHPVVSCAWHPAGHSILSCEKQRRAILWSDF